MSTMQERAALRRKNITMKIVALHSTEHHSFHIGMGVKESWELLAKLSQEAWIEQTGTQPPQRVNKSVCKFIRLEQKV